MCSQGKGKKTTSNLNHIKDMSYQGNCRSDKFDVSTCMWLTAAR
jgi:hypothetical protein